MSSEPGFIDINVSADGNIGWNTIVPDFMAPESVRETIAVKVARLDDYIRDNQIERIDLIKIDTEGFEFPVLRGLTGFLDSTPWRPVLICELAPAAYPKIGSSLAELAAFTSSYGYRCTSLVDLISVISLDQLVKTTTVLFLPPD